MRLIYNYHSPDDEIWGIRKEKTRGMRNLNRQLFSLVLCLAFVSVTIPLQSGGVLLFQSAGMRTNDYSGQGTPFGTQELQGLAAPIALYPDPLVAEMLAGATYPDQIVVANDFVRQNRSLAPGALMQAVSAQPWDPSIKALSQFPMVLDNMAHNLVWTSQLGEAYHNQQSDVMSAIQALRAKAVAAGNLKNLSQLRMSQPTPDIVLIAPANPQVVYLPLYNLGTVYGSALQIPGYTAADVPGTGISFGAAVAVGATGSGDWGWSNWSCNWYHGVVYFHDYPYFGNNAWQGGYYGGYTRYGNHLYHTKYDNAHPYTAFQNTSQPGGTSGQSSTPAGAVNVHLQSSSNPFDAASGGWANNEDLRGWGPADTGAMSTVFASWGNLTNASSFGSGGWGQRAASFRGWIAHGGTGGGWGTGGRAEGAR